MPSVMRIHDKLERMQVALRDHVSVGDGAMIAACAAVANDVAAREVEVHGALGDAGLVDDVVHAGGEETGTRKDLGGGCEHTGAGKHRTLLNRHRLASPR